MARIWLYIKCFDLGYGFKPCSDDFSVFSDPENGGSHLVWPGGLPYGLRGVPKGKSSKGPQKWPSKMGFSHKITKSSQKCVESGGNGWKHVLNHFPHFPPIFGHFLSFYGIFSFLRVIFGVIWRIFPWGPLRNHKSPKNFVKMHIIPKIIPWVDPPHQKSVLTHPRGRKSSKAIPFPLQPGIT